ncbi:MULTISPECIES: LysR family transcriptional regulator [Microbacterium]|uniref:LysR family transcriptional regulator n=1 Tax=Microbacterium TaxID=33882 RepID=UPI001F586655|nr:MULTISPECIES: LysR family transcriptional regulator [Microbacterium]MCT1366371.1 LysR family transcriptional regulator [Microbacterium sp. p3-SID131]
MLDFRQLTALRAVDEHGSVLAAAEALGWSQPTVTHHLNGLARLTRAPVVQSSRAGTRLTPAGRLWLPHASALLERAARAQADVAHALETGRRRVRLGIFPTAAARLLPALVGALSEAGYDPRITEGELHELSEALVRLGLDAAVVFDLPGEARSTPPGTHRTSLFTERFSLIVSSQHPLALGPPRRLHDFSGDPWILGVSDTDPGDANLLAAARAAGFEPINGPRSDDYRVVAAYVAAGLGVALIPELALPSEAEGVAIINLADTTLSREVSLLTAATLDHAAVELMSRVLAAEATLMTSDFD